MLSCLIQGLKRGSSTNWDENLESLERKRRPTATEREAERRRRRLRLSARDCLEYMRREKERVSELDRVPSPAPAITTTLFFYFHVTFLPLVLHSRHIIFPTNFMLQVYPRILPNYSPCVLRKNLSHTHTHTHTHLYVWFLCGTTLLNDQRDHKNEGNLSLIIAGLPRFTWDPVSFSLFNVYVSPLSPSCTQRVRIKLETIFLRSISHKHVKLHIRA